MESPNLQLRRRNDEFLEHSYIGFWSTGARCDLIDSFSDLAWCSGLDSAVVDLSSAYLGGIGRCGCCMTLTVS